jgi:hypothetical protein
MMQRIEELHLNRNYSFYVSIKNNGTHFAGELLLTPDACSLTIRGDVSQGRGPDFSHCSIDELACQSFEGTFIIYGLKPTSGHMSTKVVQKRFSEEFKNKAERQITECGHRVADVAARLGVRAWSL